MTKSFIRSFVHSFILLLAVVAMCACENKDPEVGNLGIVAYVKFENYSQSAIRFTIPDNAGTHPVDCMLQPGGKEGPFEFSCITTAELKVMKGYSEEIIYTESWKSQPGSRHTITVNADYSVDHTIEASRQ